MIINTKDVGAGITFIAVSAIYGGTALTTLDRGTLTNMGPAYFPIILCIILAGFGILLVGRGLFARSRVRVPGLVAWRGLLTIPPAVVFFAAFIREIGFAPAVFAVTFLCALASRETPPLQALALALAVAASCVAVFLYGVRLPIPVFGSWLAG